MSRCFNNYFDKSLGWKNISCQSANLVVFYGFLKKYFDQNGELQRIIDSIY